MDAKNLEKVILKYFNNECPVFEYLDSMEWVSLYSFLRSQDINLDLTMLATVHDMDSLIKLIIQSPCE